MFIRDDIFYVGVNDHELDLFEGHFEVPDGMAYNSYVIVDDKIAVMDAVEIKFGQEWLGKIREAIGDKEPDYLIVQHMEPDHSANIGTFLEAYPNAKVVGNSKTFMLMKKFYGTDYPDRQILVDDGGTLSLGRHILRFLTAPMVHWPEVMFTYDEYSKVLFTADGFGKFGALDVEADWACEARRYYFGIIGKYGMMVQAILKKVSALAIETICPLHGPVLTENLGYYIDLYNTWSSYGVESEGIFIAYTSVYGHTKEAALLLKDKLEASGCPKVAIADLAREDMAESVEDAFRYGKIVLATTTYNGDIFPYMREFINDLLERGYQNRTIGIIENGSWGPVAARFIKQRFEKSKNITFTDTTVTVNSALDDVSRGQIGDLAAELLR